MTAEEWREAVSRDPAVAVALAWAFSRRLENAQHVRFPLVQRLTTR